ncbi:aldehyde dehydrogenase [Deltaproteobacteria bacterium TL4]
MTKINIISEINQLQKNYFRLGETRNLSFRKKQLLQLKKALKSYESRILEALHQDLNKPEMEAYAEIGLILTEIEWCLKNLTAWSKPEKLKTPLGQLPATSHIYSDPLGSILIISPWNYPFDLAIKPLVGAIAAGNCGVVKPSELAPFTSQVIAQMIHDYFEPQYLSVVQGGVEETQLLLEQRWDHIFFTGSSATGRKIMMAAANHLTPVTLELGGKSPCLIDTNISIAVTARRVAWGKFFNAGQTCIAPDYVLIHRKIKDKFINALRKELLTFYGENAFESQDFARIINKAHVLRLSRLLEKANVLIGGTVDVPAKYIEPTVIDQIDWEHPVMQEEIFGPILPILEYDHIEQVIDRINDQPKPLCIYLFSRNKSLQEKILRQTSSGGVCINDTLSHSLPLNLPFGGVGHSGMGKSHGKASFDSFSHKKSTLIKSLNIDLKDRYAPYHMSLQKTKLLMRFMMT